MIILKKQQKPSKQNTLSTYLKQKLHHLSVYETLDWLSVDVSDEVTCPQSCLVCRTALLNALDPNRHNLTITGKATI